MPLNMEATRNQLKRLRVDSLYGKKNHFNAADRKDSLSNGLNIPAILIDAILTSVLLSNLQKEEPELFSLSAMLAIIATLLTGRIPSRKTLPFYELQTVVDRM